MTLDLKQIYPEKYHGSDLVEGFLETAATKYEEFSALVEGLLDLTDPQNAPDDYLQLLADTLGFLLSDADDVTVARRRNELMEAIDWYRMKGTYEAINLVALWAEFDFTIFDMYSSDYISFVDVPWFVGGDGENPTGLDSTYYKTPHFGVGTNLNQIYAAGTYDEGVLDRHLWRPSLFVGVTDHVEATRPAHTVPHYMIVLNAITTEAGEPYEQSATEVVTSVLLGWEFTKNYFNDGIVFNDGEQFNESIESFISTITKWQLGTGGGSGGIDLAEALPTALDSVLLEGTVDGYTIYDDRVEIWFFVPAATVQYNISQMGLFSVNVTETMVVCSTFPDIHKGSVTQLKVLVTIYRSNDLVGSRAYGEGYYGGDLYGT